MSIERDVYPPIQPYQTRIMRLFAINNSDSLLICTLQTADLLHTSFEGLRIRSPDGDAILEYDALSYAWGSNDKPETISCNDMFLPISTSLLEALRALRSFKREDQYLWVDAICINQDDKKEVGKQVSNIFLIYQKAREVVAWIGPAIGCSDDVREALLATDAFDGRPFTSQYDDRKVKRGLDWIYDRPYFGRLWIQQEVFAARKLRLQCGKHRFKWSDGLGRSLRTSTSIAWLGLPYSTLSIPPQRLPALKCFDGFSNKNGSKSQDFIETLLRTSMLGASNPRDHIFGILGITSTPAKAMSIRDWALDRSRGHFIPIDYKADIVSILCTVTLFALKKGGLSILVRFKAFGAGLDMIAPHALPSWVIDWRLAGRTFIYDSYVGSGQHIPDWSAIFNDLKTPRDGDLTTGVNDDLMGHTKLTVYGIVESRFYIVEGCVHLSSTSATMWHLGFQSQPGDLFVSFAKTIPMGRSQQDPWFDPNLKFLTWDRTGVWLLRPVSIASDQELRLMAFLPFIAERKLLFYNGWRKQTDTDEGTLHLDTDEQRRYRRLYTTFPSRKKQFYNCYHDRVDSARARTFTIV